MLIWERIRTHFERRLFAPLNSGGWRERLRHVAQYLYALARDLLGGRLNIHANGLVFATMLALVPLIAFSFALLRGFGAQRELEPLVYEFFLPMGSAAGEVTQKVMNFADRVRGGLLGTVGLTFLLWTLMGTLKRVEDSLNFVWHVEQPRSFMRRIAEYFALLVIAPVLIGALVGMAKLTSSNSSVQMLAHLPLLGALARGLLALIPVVIVSGVFAVIYAFIPNTRVEIVPAMVGGLTAGIFWTAIGRVFTGFVQVSTHLTIVYAGFAIFIAALVWIYFSWLILLLGAQLSFYVQNPSYLRIGLREPRLSNLENEAARPEHHVPGGPQPFAGQPALECRFAVHRTGDPGRCPRTHDARARIGGARGDDRTGYPAARARCGPHPAAGDPIGGAYGQQRPWG